MGSTVAVAGDGVALLHAAIILLVLTWVTVSIRMCVRIWRKVVGMDDYLMVAGLVCIHSIKLPNVEPIAAGAILRNSFPLHRCMLLRLRTKGEESVCSHHFERYKGKPLSRFPW